MVVVGLFVVFGLFFLVVRLFRIVMELFLVVVGLFLVVVGLFVVVVRLFDVCQLPRLIVRVSTLLLQQSSAVHLNEELVQRATNIASGLLVVNATANFFIYCLVGHSFRRGLARLCSPRAAKSTTVTTERRDEVLLERNPRTSKAVDHT